jgi:hypothetical protein
MSTDSAHDLLTYLGTCNGDKKVFGEFPTYKNHEPCHISENIYPYFENITYDRFIINFL